MHPKDSQHSKTMCPSFLCIKFVHLCINKTLILIICCIQGRGFVRVPLCYTQEDLMRFEWALAICTNLPGSLGVDPKEKPLINA